MQDPAYILSSKNPGLTLAKQTKYQGPVEISELEERQLVDDINSKRLDEEKLAWHWRESANNLSLLAEPNAVSQLCTLKTGL